MGVSIMRLSLTGTGFSIDTDGFGAVNGIAGTLTSFNFLNMIEVDTSTFDGVQGSLSANGDVNLALTGPAQVKGVMIPIVLVATKTAGVIDFELTNAVTGQILAGGIGEVGRSDLELTIRP
jgi:hypothetical protein